MHNLEMIVFYTSCSLFNNIIYFLHVQPVQNLFFFLILQIILSSESYCKVISPPSSVHSPSWVSLQRPYQGLARKISPHLPLLSSFPSSLPRSYLLFFSSLCRFFFPLSIFVFNFSLSHLIPVMPLSPVTCSLMFYLFTTFTLFVFFFLQVNIQWITESEKTSPAAVFLPWFLYVFVRLKGGFVLTGEGKRFMTQQSLSGPHTHTHSEPHIHIHTQF